MEQKVRDLLATRQYQFLLVTDTQTLRLTRSEVERIAGDVRTCVVVDEDTCVIELNQ